MAAKDPPVPKPNENQAAAEVGETASPNPAADIEDRFARTALLLGSEGLEKLRRAFVVVAGLGAVGSYAVEGLARAGVGRLRLVDFDRVRRSNINRQLYALETTLGRLKTEVAAERVRDINPACRVEALPIFIGEENAADILADHPDVLIDAIDSLSPKLHLLRAAVGAGICVISSMGAATRTDPLALRVADLSQTRECPLARLVRKRLAREGIRTGIRCVFSVEPAWPVARATTPEPHGYTVRRGRPRMPLGSLSVITGMFGLIAAREAIFEILRK